MIAIRALFVLAIAASLPAVLAQAQNDPRLVDAVRLARDGQGDSARAVTARLRAATPVTDTLYPEILYTEGVVAATVETRRLALQRVTIEYAQSPWADDALLLLAQLEYAGDDPSLAARYVDRLLTDYPATDLLPQATLWGARAAYESRNPALACRFARTGLARAGDVELENQLTFQLRRCEAALAQDSARAATPPPPPPPPPPPAATGPSYRVQTAAVRSRTDADPIVRRLKQLGYESVVVQEGGFFKIQAGPFPTRDAAAAALRTIATTFGTRPFIVPMKR